jgi:general secretion pathway protein E
MNKKATQSSKTSDAETPDEDLLTPACHEDLVHELLSVIDKRVVTDEKEELHDPFEAVSLLRDAMRERASDIHIDTQVEGVLVRLRIDGAVIDGALLSHPFGKRLGNQLKVTCGLDPITKYLPEEGRGSHEVDGVSLDLRMAHAPCLNGDKISVRILDPRLPPLTLTQLGLHSTALEHIQDWLDNVHGMLLVAGPTCSGKTTTLYALLHRLRLHRKNVVSIEDPVEYQVYGINHIQVDMKHGLGFPEGIKAILRMDPDYVMLGEIRDAASAQAAVVAAASGRPLLSTIHSRDASGVIDVLRNFKLNDHEISSHLVMVVAQRLVRLLCLECRKKESPTVRERRWLELLGKKVPAHVWHAKGCDACRQLGYKGRTGVFEVWRVHADDYSLILQGIDRKRLYEHLREQGHIFMLDDGLSKAADGLTSLDEIRGLGGLSAFQSEYERTRRF